jgi:predicted nucleic acid-binding protein
LKLFVDTGAFVAIKDRSDSHHLAAVSFNRASIEQKRQFVTTTYVVDETLTLLKIRANHRIAVQFGEEIRASRLLRIVHVTPEILEEAWKIFVKADDQPFSFTDCVSFSVMLREKISSAFAFDGHFEQYGFEQLPLT